MRIFTNICAAASAFLLTNALFDIREGLESSFFIIVGTLTFIGFLTGVLMNNRRIDKE